MTSSWNILQTGMRRKPRCRWKKCNKWFGKQAWFYIYNHRYFCSPSCVVDYCLEQTPEQRVTELDFRIKAMPIPKRPEKLISLSWKPETEYVEGKYIAKGIRHFPLALTDSKEDPKLSGSISGPINDEMLKTLKGEKKKRQEKDNDLDYRTEKVGSEIRVGFVPENLPPRKKKKPFPVPNREDDLENRPW